MSSNEEAGALVAVNPAALKHAMNGVGFAAMNQRGLLRRPFAMMNVESGNVSDAVRQAYERVKSSAWFARAVGKFYDELGRPGERGDWRLPHSVQLDDETESRLVGLVMHIAEQLRYAEESAASSGRRAITNSGESRAFFADEFIRRLADLDMQTMRFLNEVSIMTNSERAATGHKAIMAYLDGLASDRTDLPQRRFTEAARSILNNDDVSGVVHRMELDDPPEEDAPMGPVHVAVGTGNDSYDPQDWQVVVSADGERGGVVHKVPPGKRQRVGEGTAPAAPSFYIDPRVREQIDRFHAAALTPPPLIGKGGWMKAYDDLLAQRERESRRTTQIDRESGAVTVWEPAPDPDDMDLFSSSQASSVPSLAAPPKPLAIAANSDANAKWARGVADLAASRRQITAKAAAAPTGGQLVATTPSGQVVPKAEPARTAAVAGTADRQVVVSGSGRVVAAAPQTAVVAQSSDGQLVTTAQPSTMQVDAPQRGRGAVAVAAATKRARSAEYKARDAEAARARRAAKKAAEEAEMAVAVREGRAVVGAGERLPPKPRADKRKLQDAPPADGVAAPAPEPEVAAQVAAKRRPLVLPPPRNAHPAIEGRAPADAVDLMNRRMAEVDDDDEDTGLRSARGPMLQRIHDTVWGVHMPRHHLHGQSLQNHVRGNPLNVYERDPTGGKRLVYAGSVPTGFKSWHDLKF